MKAKQWLFAIVAIAAVASLSYAAEPADSIAAYHAAIHKAFGVPEPVIVQLVDRGVSAEELPAVALIASRAKVEPAKVIELRDSGMTYVQVSQKLGVGPEVFYVPFESDPGPPYGKAWGYWKVTPKEQWNKITLSDEEVIGLANLQLISDVYQVPPVKTIEMRKAGKDYVLIHRELAGGAMVVAPGVVASGTAPATSTTVIVQAPRISERAGYNMEGGDYTHVKLNSLAECQRTCTREEQCLAYTFDTDDRMCYLKDVVGRYSQRSDSVSGEKGS
jgi:hypothetical protein